MMFFYRMEVKVCLQYSQWHVHVQGSVVCNKVFVTRRAVTSVFVSRGWKDFSSLVVIKSCVYVRVGRYSWLMLKGVVNETVIYITMDLYRDPWNSSTRANVRGQYVNGKLNQHKYCLFTKEVSNVGDLQNSISRSVSLVMYSCIDFMEDTLSSTSSSTDLLVFFSY